MRRDITEEPSEESHYDDDENPTIFRDFGDFPGEDKFNLFTDSPSQHFTEEEIEAYDREERERKIHLNLDGNFSSRIRSFTKKDKYAWGDLKSKVFGNFGKPKSLPGVEHVAYVPERQSDEIVLERYGVLYSITTLRAFY